MSVPARSRMIPPKWPVWSAGVFSGSAVSWDRLGHVFSEPHAASVGRPKRTASTMTDSPVPSHAGLIDRWVASRDPHAIVQHIAGTNAARRQSERLTGSTIAKEKRLLPTCLAGEGSALPSRGREQMTQNGM